MTRTMPVERFGRYVQAVLISENVPNAGKMNKIIKRVEAPDSSTASPREQENVTGGMPQTGIPMTRLSSTHGKNAGGPMT